MPGFKTAQEANHHAISSGIRKLFSRLEDVVGGRRGGSLAVRIASAAHTAHARESNRSKFFAESRQPHRLEEEGESEARKDDTVLEVADSEVVKVRNWESAGSGFFAPRTAGISHDKIKKRIAPAGGGGTGPPPVLVRDTI